MATDISAAVRSSAEGAVIDIEVQPGSSRPGKLSYDEWRKRIKLSVGERAQKGKANEDVLSTLAEILDVPENSLRILSGLTERKKSILVAGMEQEAVRRHIEKAMDDKGSKPAPPSRMKEAGK
jgi:uncharacterized protein (TIGR00251 family)